MFYDSRPIMPPAKLEVIVPDRFATGWKQAAVCGAFVLMFLYFAYVPASAPDLWNAITSESSTLDSIPLSEGIRHIETGPFSNFVISAVYKRGGVELLSFTFAMIALATMSIWSVVFVRVTGRWWTALGSLLLALISIPFLSGLTPNSFGGLMFAAFAYCITRCTQDTDGDSRSVVLSNSSMPLRVSTLFLIVLWSNIHASFVIGITWLGCLVFSRILIVMREVGIWRTSADRELQSRIWLLEFAALATLLTPNGLTLWTSCFWWPDNPIMHDLLGYHPTLLASWVGASIILLWIAAGVVARHRSVQLEWLLPPALLTIATAFSKGLVIWLAPILLIFVAMTLGAQKSDCKGNCDSGDRKRNLPTLGFAFTLISGLMIWLGFCFSPWAGFALGGKTRTKTQIVGNQFPQRAAEELKSLSSDRPLFCPAEWSDWLQTQSNVPVFVNGDSGRFPRTVLNDYQAIYEGESNWKRIAEKYALKHILIDRKEQTQLIRRIRQDPGRWRLQYEDNKTLLFSNES